MTSELTNDGFGTNGWIKGSKKTRRSVAGGYMVIVWGDWWCFDEFNSWKVSGRPVVLLIDLYIWKKQ